MRKHETKEIKKVEEVENGIICDICKKEIKGEKDYKRRYLKMEHFYEVTTHHHDWGNDSIDSYENRDICGEECLFKFLKEYFDGTDATLCCEIEEVRI